MQVTAADPDGSILNTAIIRNLGDATIRSIVRRGRPLGKVWSVSPETLTELRSEPFLLGLSFHPLLLGLSPALFL